MYGSKKMNTEKLILPVGYEDLLLEIKELILTSRNNALRVVNRELISLYWDIGYLIIEKQAGQTWGKSIVNQLSHDLKNEFPGAKGFSPSNLWRMKGFYEIYSDDEKLAQLVREIGWSHNIAIMERCNSCLEREFYIRMTIDHNWSRNVLIHQIENHSFETTMMGQTNFDKVIPRSQGNLARISIKDEYIFDFLDMSEKHTERELEKALILRIEEFLRTMGGSFTFVGSQFNIHVDNKDYFLDLLLFHRRLKCLVAVELKTGEFQPEYVGKMQFYLTALDRLIKEKDENPSIGMIICKEKNRTIVEYALHDSNKPIGVSTYRIVRELPVELKGELPSPSEIKKLMVTFYKDR